MKDLIIECLREIDDVYFNQATTYFRDYEIVEREEIIRAIEASFVAEFRGNLKTKLKPNYPAFRFDVEAPKVLVYSNQNVPKEIIDSYNRIFDKIRDNAGGEKRLYRIPDIVVHRSEMSMLAEDQLLICEIKTDPEISISDFYADFFKLNLYLSELDFQIGVFVAANLYHETLADWLKSYIDQGFFICDKNKNILLISIDDKVKDISVIDFSIYWDRITEGITPEYIELIFAHYPK